MSTGLAQGSLYKAFRDKNHIFQSVFERYRAVRMAKIMQAIADGTSGFDQLSRVLQVYVQSSQGDEGKQGCLVVSSLMELASFKPEMIKKISCALESNQQLLFKLITLGQQDGSIRHDMNGQDVALHMLCLIQGMRVVAKTGKYQAEQMQHVVDLALIQMKV